MNILFIDDNYIEHFLVQNILLKIKDVKVFCAKGIIDADLILSKNKINLIILDIFLGEQSGIVIGDYLRGCRQTERTPIIFYSASSDPKVMRDASKISPYFIFKSQTIAGDLENLVKMILDLNEE